MSKAVTFAKTNQHTIRVYVPISLAKVLRDVPESIGHAVYAFYYREPTEASHVASRMKTFTPITMVHTMVTLSRCMYGQLRQQLLHPSKLFEPFVPDSEEHRDFHASDIGMKLAIGMELLVKNQSSSIVDKVVEEAASLKVEDSVFRTWEDDTCEWMEIPPDSLEQVLRQEAQEGNFTELEDLPKFMDKFVTNLSSHKGVETFDDDDISSSDSEISFDLDLVKNILLNK